MHNYTKTELNRLREKYIKHKKLTRAQKKMFADAKKFNNLFGKSSSIAGGYKLAVHWDDYSLESPNNYFGSSRHNIQRLMYKNPIETIDLYDKKRSCLLCEHYIPRDNTCTYTPNSVHKNPHDHCASYEYCGNLNGVEYEADQIIDSNNKYFGILDTYKKEVYDTEIVPILKMFDLLVKKYKDNDDLITPEELKDFDNLFDEHSSLVYAQILLNNIYPDIMSKYKKYKDMISEISRNLIIIENYDKETYEWRDAVRKITFMKIDKKILRDIINFKKEWMLFSKKIKFNEQFIDDYDKNVDKMLEKIKLYYNTHHHVNVFDENLKNIVDPPKPKKTVKKKIVTKGNKPEEPKSEGFIKKFLKIVNGEK